MGFSEIHTTWYFAWGALALAIVALFVGFYYGCRGIHIVQPRYIFMHKTIVRDNLSQYQGLRVLYQRRPVTNLTITNLAFWNAGFGALTPNSIKSSEPIEIVAHDDVKIYSASVVHDSDMDCNLRVISTSSKVHRIEFDSVGHMQGCVIQIMHNGMRKRSLKLRGKPKSAFSKLSGYSTKEDIRPLIYVYFYLVFMLAMACVMIYLGNWIGSFRPQPALQSDSAFVRS
jgi:hypothetical protein